MGACPRTHPSRHIKTGTRWGAGMPLIASKLEREHDEEGISPPRRVQMGQRDEEGGLPLLIASELEWKHDEEGYIPFSPCQNGTTRQGGASPLLIVSELEWKHDEEGYIPPRHVEMGTTRQGGVSPSLSHPNGNKNAMGRVCPLPVASKWE